MECTSEMFAALLTKIGELALAVWARLVEGGGIVCAASDARTARTSDMRVSPSRPRPR